MSRVSSLVTERARGAWAAWDRFWFTPSDPATLGILRILAGAMLVYTHAVWTLDLEGFFGPEGWVSAEAVRMLHRGTWAWSYFWWFDSTTVLWAVHVAALIVFVMLTVGLLSRVSSILAAVATLAYANRAPAPLFGLDLINVLLALYLAVGPSGAAYSVDRWLARRRHGAALPPETSVGANVAVRLVQVHMCVVYFCSGASKLMGPAWWDGTALWGAVANLEYQSVDLTWLAGWPVLLALLTNVTVLWELGYAALVWPRATRPFVLALALPVHLGIGLFLGMLTFGLIMIVGNLAFVPPEVFRSLVRVPSFVRRRSKAADTISPVA